MDRFYSNFKQLDVEKSINVPVNLPGVIDGVPTKP